ncbi:unnamed protein product [Mytilus coruscus]|uniref:DZIP3-like HEPN domain-containing protein n=1 Tax=Mytilus coruscus TaxID=42192 RepID=A0A6J8C350_MYTCO|nr:unnamed protein product [Mytilus coruscus]
MPDMDEIFVLTSVVFQIFVLSVESYSLKCPSQASWKLRAQVTCNRTLKYFCLYNSVIGEYVEGCNGPDWDRKGSKRIYAGDFSRGNCLKQRFQPFIFWTNGSVSDCIYAKSICSEEGQVEYKDSSSKDDRVCRCDSEKNYSFVKTPRNVCFCIPTEEDCSCYHKLCPVNYALSADYRCTKRDSKEETKCIDITKYNKTLDEDTDGVSMNNNNLSSMFKWVDTAAACVLVCFCFILIIGGCVFVFLSKLQPLKRHLQRKHKDKSVYRKEQEDVNERRKFILGQLITDEVNYLRIIHLLFRVASQVVRITFNHEIQPNQLRKTLNINKAALEKKYRKREKIINDFQWNLLFGLGKVSSEDFDIRLMIYLLETVADIKVGNLYPVSSDMSISGMLSRIKYIRNETTRRFDRKLSDYQFNQYWDDIGQAVLKLVSSRKLVIEKNQEKNRLIDRLVALNPIAIDNKKLCEFIEMSERYPAMILQQLISEYSISEQVTIEDILRENKHELYHKLNNTEACCQCTTKCNTFIKALHKTAWETLYEVNDGSNSHFCTSDLRNCSERFVPKRIKTLHLSVAKSLIFNIPNIFTFMIRRLCDTGFDKFIMQNQHTLYHHMEKKRCCQCNNVSTEKLFINKTEWNKLFMSLEGLNVKLVHIPKEFSLPHRTRKLTNITSEENNFLVAVLGFKKIVYPVIKNHFNTQCSDDVLNQIRMNIYEEQSTHDSKYFRKDETGKEEWKNVDLKLMIYILKRITKKEEMNEYVDQLCIIDNIRREIVQSSSGVLDEKRFNDIIKSIRKAVLYLGGEFYEEKLLHLQHIQNILGQNTINTTDIECQDKQNAPEVCFKIKE